MPYYRKKPVVIEAVQWKNGTLQGGATRWIIDAINAVPGSTGSLMRVGMDVHICTLEGVMVASDGDYIIRGIQGELYPCKPDIFEKTYEPVSSGAE